MKEEVELISNYYNISFICSFGYSVETRTPATDRMGDMYVLVDDWGRKYLVFRRDFFDFVSDKHGGVVKGKPKLNTLKDHDLLNYGIKRKVSKWTRSRVLRDFID